VLYFDDVWHEKKTNEFLVIFMFDIICIFETGNQIEIYFCLLLLSGLASTRALLKWSGDWSMTSWS